MKRTSTTGPHAIGTVGLTLHELDAIIAQRRPIALSRDAVAAVIGATPTSAIA